MPSTKRLTNEDLHSFHNACEYLLLYNTDKG